MDELEINKKVLSPSITKYDDMAYLFCKIHVYRSFNLRAILNTNTTHTYGSMLMYIKPFTDVNGYKYVFYSIVLIRIVQTFSSLFNKIMVNVSCI